MRHFPIYMKVNDKRICVIGNDEAVIAKLRLLMKSDALLEHYGSAPDDDIAAFLQAHDAIMSHKRAFRPSDITDNRRPAIAFAYLSAPDKTLMGHLVAANIPYCVIDNLEESLFTTPAIIDRAPLTIAIGTEGRAPVLARRLKKELEDRLPHSISILANAAGDLRHKVAKKLPAAQRRHFWSRFFEITDGEVTQEHAQQQADRLLDAMQEGVTHQPKPVWFVNASAGCADLLTMQARRILHEADMVVSDPLIAKPILELCRREAEFMTASVISGKAPYLAAMAKQAQKGRYIVRLYQGFDGQGASGIGASGVAAIEEEIRQLRCMNVTAEIAAYVASPSAQPALWQPSVTGVPTCQRPSLN